MRRLATIFFLTTLWLATAWGGAADVQGQPLQNASSQMKSLLADPVPATNAPVWQSSISLGFTMSQGNSDTMLVSGRFRTDRKTSANEWMLGADGAYGQSDNQANTETVHGATQFNHLFTDRFYGFGRVDALHDGIKDIAYRVTLSPGLGYYLLKQTNLAMAVESGPSYVDEKQGSDTQGYAAWRFADRFEYKFDSHVRCWQGCEMIPQLNQTDNFIINAEAGIEAPLTKELSLQVTVQDNYVNLPAPDYKHNDVRIVSGISYKF